MASVQSLEPACTVHGGHSLKVSMDTMQPFHVMPLTGIAVPVGLMEPLWLLHTQEQADVRMALCYQAAGGVCAEPRRLVLRAVLKMGIFKGIDGVSLQEVPANRPFFPA